MNPDRINVHCEPIAPRTTLSGVFHTFWAVEKIAITRPVEGHLDQEVHCPTCGAPLVVRTFSWAWTATVRRRRKLLILALLVLLVGWITAAVLVAPALRLPLVVAAVPIFFLLMGLTAWLMEATGAELRDGVEHDGVHPKHRLDSRPRPAT